MSRSVLDRLRRMRGHFRLTASSKPDDEHKPFKAYEPGYVARRCEVPAADAG